MPSATARRCSPKRAGEAHVGAVFPDPTLTEPILYSFRRCPYAMRARMALLVSGTPCEIREVKLATSRQR
jgi:hypothetical protein